MALTLAAGMSLTGCKADTEPRLEKPTEFHLNTPAMANQTFVLTANDGVDLTVSQPNYGLGVVSNYETQVSFTEDFASYESVEGLSQQASFTVNGENLSQALCKLMGYVSNETQDKFSADPRTVYFRVRSFVANCDYGDILSNVIPLTIAPYPAAKLPARIYLVGEVQGWDINAGTFILEEAADAVGSNIYYGTFEMTHDQANVGFRFYKTLGEWGDNGNLPSIGANANDGDNASVQMENGVYNGACVYGKGNWNITNWDGGKMKMTVNLQTMKVTFEAAE